MFYARAGCMGRDITTIHAEFIFLSDSFVKPSTYCNVFTSVSPHLVSLDLHIVNAGFSKI